MSLYWLPLSELWVEFEKLSLRAMQIWVKKLHVILHQWYHCIDWRSRCGACAMLLNGGIVPFRVLHAVRTRLRSWWWFRCTHYYLFALRVSSRSKHDLVAHLLLNTKTLKKAPTPLLGSFLEWELGQKWRYGDVVHLKHAYVMLKVVSSDKF